MLSALALFAASTHFLPSGSFGDGWFAALERLFWGFAALAGIYWFWSDLRRWLKGEDGTVLEDGE
jgi:hypothetical protein